MFKRSIGAGVVQNRVSFEKCKLAAPCGVPGRWPPCSALCLPSRCPLQGAQGRGLSLPGPTQLVRPPVCQIGVWNHWDSSRMPPWVHHAPPQTSGPSSVRCRCTQPLPCVVCGALCQTARSGGQAPLCLTRHCSPSSVSVQ